MSIEFSPDDKEIRPIKGISNRGSNNEFLTRANDAWARLARYCDLYEHGRMDELLAEIDRNTRDDAIHVNAVLLMAVRMSSALAKLNGRPASRIALAFASMSNTALEIRSAIDRWRLPR